MKTVVVAVVMATLSLTVSSASAELERSAFVQKERWVSAHVLSLDETGCVATVVTVLANADTTRTFPGPAAARQRLVTVQIFRGDSCTGDLLLDAYGEAAPQVLQV